ncbi:BQ2448_6878 [Microbotryum intermedium]|uniref:BQ2448_6878 protein n=1 Tax=Microbotryum intermedium TaxID=269621 RepID=A0A238FLQ2_9BASI|nr:BQ2448_6878 [Microbotryum intermedium]
MSPSLEITYTINVPETLNNPTPPLPLTKAPSTATLRFPLNSTLTRNEWLSSLEKGLGEARDDLNTCLSEWKEVMKPFEKVEGGKKKKQNGEDEEGDEEGEEE